MGRLSFQVLEGLEAGHSFDDIETPFTIGREEDNDIQLNDERISRFHAKVQEDGGRMILTDLDSTNGTRVNGHPIRMRVLRTGDLISIGRCVLLVGGLEELRALNQKLAEVDPENESVDLMESIESFPHGPPTPPSHLSALQSAMLSDVLEYIRTEILSAVSVQTDEMHVDGQDYLRVPRATWSRLQLLAGDISRLQNDVVDPD